jgi:iron complex transport system substrate-binding protein
MMPMLAARMAGLCLFLLLIALPASATRTVTDETGRVVVVPDHPHRVICLVPSIVDDVYALGAGDEIVGRSDYLKYPAEALKKPSVGSMFSPSLETIVALHPDLVLSMKMENGSSAMEKIRQIGVPVYMIDPHGVEGIFKGLASIGDALNRKAEADAAVAKLRARVEKVKASVKGKPVFSILMPIDYDPLVTIGRGAFITEMIAIAGARSVTDDVVQEWPQMSVEAIVARAPDALLMVREGHTRFAVLKDRPGWRSMPAVKNARVYYVDDRVDLASPIAIDALEDMAREFHP